MKSKRKILITVIALHASSVIADVKKITCVGDNVYDGMRLESEWTAVFDTDDFKKESPTYEHTFVKRLENGVPNESQGDMVGNTYRYPMRVSPSVISLDYCLVVDIFGTSCFFPEPGINLMSTVNVDRKNLSLSGGMSGNYSCRIEDYGTENVI